MSAKGCQTIWATPEVSTKRHGEFAWLLLDLINALAKEDWPEAAVLSHQIQDHADEHEIAEASGEDRGNWIGPEVRP